MARDVLTCNGKNPKGSDNGLYKAICDDYADRFDPKTPFAYDPYTFCEVTDIDESKDTPDNPGELVPCCIAMFESGSFETDTLVYLWVQLAFGADKYGPNTVRAIMSSYSEKPRLEKHPEIEFYEVNKQTV